jgi:hypothetical protein
VVSTANEHLEVLRGNEPWPVAQGYQLACQAGDADSDSFIICNLPLFLADSARTWLEHLPPNKIQIWADLKEIFVGNFQGTYTPWEPMGPKELPTEARRSSL